MTPTPTYNLRAIGSAEALSRMLQLPVPRIRYLAQNASDFYRVARIKTKANGDKRITYDAYRSLKDVHKTLKVRLFQNVSYPDYIQGAISGRSYIGNVKKHTKSTIIICEDITNFFPTIRESDVEKMFMRLFHFPKEVASILTGLVTLNGTVPQGGVCSSYVANLVMWERESALVSLLQAKNLTYTRYVDDITVSSKDYIEKVEISSVIASIYGMLKHFGVKPNKAKHEVLSNGMHQKVHRVGVNGKRPSFGKEEKKRVRSAVYNLEALFKDNACSYDEYLKAFNSASALVAKLKQLNEHQGQKYRESLNLIKPSAKRIELSNQ